MGFTRKLLTLNQIDHIPQKLKRMFLKEGRGRHWLRPSSDTLLSSIDYCIYFLIKVVKHTVSVRYKSLPHVTLTMISLTLMVCNRCGAIKNQFHGLWRHLVRGTNVHRFLHVHTFVRDIYLILSQINVYYHITTLPPQKPSLYNDELILSPRWPMWRGSIGHLAMVLKWTLLSLLPHLL